MSITRVASTASMSYTAHFEHISDALRSRWEAFRTLEDEQRAFVPKPLADFADEAVAMRAEIRRLNPQKSAESIDEFVEKQIELAVSPSFQFAERFSSRHMAEYVTVLMLSHSLCEALINAILAIGLSKTKTPELFSLLESADIKKKWRVAPKAITRDYSFPGGHGIDETMTKLCSERNAFVHHKIALSVDGKEVFKGSVTERHDFSEGLKWMHRYFSLPYDLADFACEVIGNDTLWLPMRCTPIVLAPEHKKTRRT